MKHFLFSDDEVWHRSIYANSWRHAILLARDVFQIKGRLRMTLWDGDLREYHLVDSNYDFSLKQVFHSEEN